MNINEKRIIKTFTELAAISSPSWEEKQVIAYIQKYLKDIGIPSKKLPCGKSHNLYVSIKGSIKDTPLLLSCHTDTVTPCENVKPVIQKDRITSDGTTILGSDDKSAIAMFLEAVTILKEEKIAHRTIEILFSCAEEIGLHGIKEFDMSLIKSKEAYVFDSDGPIGSVILEAPYHAKMTLKVLGKAAHAGMAVEKGKNAIVALSHLITQLPQGNIDENTTFNVGIISGGSATNIVAPEAFCDIEFRSINKKKIEDVRAQVKLLAKETANSFSVKIKTDYELEYGGFSLEKDDAVVKKAVSALKSIGIKAKYKSSGGGSDTNIMNSKGINAVNLSCGMEKVHTTDEFIMIKELIKGAQLTLALIRKS